MDDSYENEETELDKHAVTLEYKHGETDAPIVTASGQGHVAKQMVEIAIANGIKVHKDSDLVEILRAVEVNAAIPLEAFAAVAEILAYIYKANSEYPDWLELE